MARFERFGVLGTETGGVFFTESSLPSATLLGEVVAASDRQNIPLTKLKEKLANEVLRKGGNVLTNFSYEQRGSVFSFSSTRMTAKGVAARI